MKVLIVLAGKREDYFALQNKPFVYEQVKALESRGVNFEYYFIEGGGKSYLKHFFNIRTKVDEENLDLLHAHYGLSGLISLFQKRIPTVITFHGSDVNKGFNRVLSWIATKFSNHNILVNDYMVQQLSLKKNYSVIPCGVDFDQFYPMDKLRAKQELELKEEKKYILFSSAFDNEVKNYPLAKKSVAQLNKNVELLELKNRTRKEVRLLFNACELLLMTSFSEGSPQVVKEALACHTPVVSTDVGDVRELLNGVNNCFITSYNPNDVALKIEKILNSTESIESSDNIQRFDQNKIAQKIESIYTELI